MTLALREDTLRAGRMLQLLRRLLNLRLLLDKGDAVS
jgi:hypothetical protein